MTVCVCVCGVCVCVCVCVCYRVLYILPLHLCEIHAVVVWLCLQFLSIFILSNSRHTLSVCVCVCVCVTEI